MTVRSDAVDAVNESLHRFWGWLGMRFKRNGAEKRYVWVPELQKRRYRKSGELALHWHSAVACAGGSLPDVAYVPDARRHYQVRHDGAVVSAGELVKGWGYGQVMCEQARESLVGYLGKYFGKEYESFKGYKPEWSSLRRFGSSQLGLYGFPRWASDELRLFAENGVPLECLSIRRDGGYVYLYVDRYRVPRVDDGSFCATERVHELVYSIKSPWKVVKNPLEGPSEALERALVKLGG
jgi:hypothetical protein